MTSTIYEQTQLVQIASDGEWYVAVPHPERPGVLVVDIDKNLTFAAEHTPETLTAVKPVPALNRFIHLRLEFIPGMLNASAFNLLAMMLYQTIANLPQPDPDPQARLTRLTLMELLATLGQGLHQALTVEPSREETPYIEHDFIDFGLQARLAWANEGNEL
jgi:hypothetical protein